MSLKTGITKIKKGKNIFIYILSFLASGFGLLLNFVLAKYLQADQFGNLQFLVALATTISQFLILGMNTFLIREAKNEKQNGEVFNKCATLFFVIVVFFLPVVFFILKNYLLVSFNNRHLILIVIGMSILLGLNSLVSAYFQGSGKYHLTIIFENLLPKLFLLCVSLIFIFLGFKTALSENYLVFYVIIYAVIAIPFSIYLFRKINLSFTKGEIKSILYFFGVAITYSLGNNLTKVLQGSLFKNSIALGIISISLSIVSLVSIFTSVLDNIVRPIFAKQKRENDIQGLIETYRFETRVNMYVAIPLYLFFMLHPNKFLIFFGESYLTYPNILIIITGAYMVNGVTGSNGILLAMTGNEKWELFNGIIYFITYFAFIFAFSSQPVYGLSFALLISQVAVNIAKYIEVWKLYKIAPLDWKSIVTLLLVCAVDFVSIFALRFVTLNLALWFVIGISTGLILVVANFLLISLYRKKDFKTLLKIKL